MLQNCFFGFLLTPQSASELIFLVFYQRCYVLQNLLFGFLSTPQRPSVLIYFGFLSTMQNCFFFGFLSTPQSDSELLFLVSYQLRKMPIITFLWFPTNTAKFFWFLIKVAKCCRIFFFWFLINAARWFKNTCLLVSYQRRKRLQN